MINYPLLSIETSDVLCGVAVVSENNVLIEKHIQEKNVHSEMLISLIDEALIEARLDIKSVRTVAISNGPGSFTGLRIGHAVSKGIAFANSGCIIQVPTLHTMALQLFVENGKRNFVIATKVNAKELYAARFTISHKNDILHGSISVIPNNEISAFSADYEVFGNYDGIDESHFVSFPKPEFVAAWAIEFGKPLNKDDFAFIEPDYQKPFVIKEIKSV